MGKRSNRRRRRIQRGVGKHKIKTKPLEINGCETIFGIEKSAFFHVGAKCFEILYQGSVFFQLVPFRRITTSGQYIPLNWKQKVGHYSVLCLGFVILLQKTLGTLDLLLFEELKIHVHQPIHHLNGGYDGWPWSLGTTGRNFGSAQQLASHSLLYPRDPRR